MCLIVGVGVCAKVVEQSWNPFSWLRRSTNSWERESWLTSSKDVMFLTRPRQRSVIFIVQILYVIFINITLLYLLMGDFLTAEWHCRLFKINMSYASLLLKVNNLNPIKSALLENPTHLFMLLLLDGVFSPSIAAVCFRFNRIWSVFNCKGVFFGLFLI